MFIRRFVLSSLVALSFAARAAAQGEGAPAPEAPPADAPDSAPPDSAPPVSDEDIGEGDEEDPARPPPKGKGVIWGVITDTLRGEPIIEGTVSVVGTKIQAVTDIDGRYRLELPPGTYSIRIFYELHQPARIDGVRVTAGQVTRTDVKLAPDEAAIDVMEVETEADRAALEGQTLARQRSAAVGDGVGRAEIAKTTDRNAAQSAQRVVGATIIGNRFVYVRGLGERYTNALLNGTPLPSPEPDVNAVPLDLFPSLVLDSLTIAKTFTPDSPADFAGGSVRIQTREIPGKLILSPSVSLGYNSQSTFRERLSYRGSGTDWLGFDSGLRALPDTIPNFKLSRNSPRPDGTLLDDAALEPHGESINTLMSTQRALNPPNYSASLVVGDGFELGGEKRFGYMLALTYSRSFLIRDEIYREYGLTAGELTRNVDFNIETGIDAVRWGAFGSATYAFSNDHRLTLTGLRSQLADNSARVSEGPDDITRVVRHQTRLSFISRELSYGQLRGEHEFRQLERANLDWNVSIARAGRSEPNTRDTVWELEPESGRTQFQYAGSNVQAGRHLYADQGETALGAGVDFTQPLVSEPRDTKLKLGGLVNLRTREFTARRFNFEFGESPVFAPPVLCPGPGFNESCNDALFINDNIGQPNSILRLNESTQPTDAYDAELNVYSVYYMGDISLAEDFRVIAGHRLEITRQTIDPFDQFATGASTSGADLNSTDLLPALGLVYSATKQSKMRASVTQTIARPQLRELAPYLYNEIVGGRTVTGNPSLKLTKITNGDLRFEYFPTLKEVLAFSFFAKHFVDPIETVIIQTGAASTLTYENSPAADLIGLEAEARKSLAFLTKHLSDFTLITNLTLARSRTTVRQTGADFITNTSRPLTNQAPYVLNIALDYSGEHLNARLLYNISGARVVEVGTGGLDDSYAQPRHLFDASVSRDFGKHFNVKLSAENILNEPVLITLGEEARDDNVVREYTDGTIYTVSAQYTF